MKSRNFSRELGWSLHITYRKTQVTDRQKNRHEDRQTERDRQTDKQTWRLRDRQTDRRIDRQTDVETDRQTWRQTDIQRDRRRDRQTWRQTDRQTDRRGDRQTERRANWETDRQTWRQRDRQTERQMWRLTASVWWLVESSADTCPLLELDELVQSASNVMPQPSTNVDSEWKCASSRMASVNSDSDQLSVPCLRLCHTHISLSSTLNQTVNLYRLLTRPNTH